MSVINMYIQIPLADNNPIYSREMFADAYLTKTGEVWVHDNIEDANSVVMMMGSTRCTEQMASELKDSFPMMKYELVVEGEGLPIGFIQKITEEI